MARRCVGQDRPPLPDSRVPQLAMLEGKITRYEELAIKLDAIYADGLGPLGMFLNPGLCRSANKPSLQSSPPMTP